MTQCNGVANLAHHDSRSPPTNVSAVFVDQATQNLSHWVEDKLRTLEDILEINGDNFGHAQIKCRIAGGHQVRELPSLHDDECQMFETIAYSRRRTHLYYYG